MIDPIAVITYLSKNMSSIDSVQILPKYSGLYTFGLINNPFSKDPRLSRLAEGSFLYLGKSEKNLHDRVFGKHLNSTRTGSSTLRRTLGALLLDELQLTPIPRSKTEKTERRFENYKFVTDGEERLTGWMRANLQVAYWEAPPNYLFLKDLEAAVIQLARPGLNLESTNPLKSELTRRRNFCCQQAKIF